MIIVTSPGSNLTEEVATAYGMQVTPQQIIVDGVAHDTRRGIPLETVDAWIGAAKVHPHVVGTTAAEFIPILREAAKTDRHVLAIMTSRKLIGSHDAALVAARKICERETNSPIRVVVADTGVTDVGAGLACILAAEASAAGIDLAAMPVLLDAFRGAVQFVITVETLERLVKSGRATMLRAFLANLLGVRPVIGFVDGELKAVSKASTKIASPKVLSSTLEASLGAGRHIWAGIFHGGVPEKAELLARELRARFVVDFLFVRPLSSSIYLAAGPGALGVAAVPLDALPWRPKRPPKVPSSTVGL